MSNMFHVRPPGVGPAAVGVAKLIAPAACTCSMVSLVLGTSHAEALQACAAALLSTTACQGQARAALSLRTVKEWQQLL